MRHVLAVLILGATLALTASAAFATQRIDGYAAQRIDGYNVSTYSGCQAFYHRIEKNDN